MSRLFKPGDRVQKRSGGPVMVVQKYIMENRSWIGWQQSNNLVECTWYESGSGFKRQVYNQYNLVPAVSIPLNARINKDRILDKVLRQRLK